MARTPAQWVDMVERLVARNGETSALTFTRRNTTAYSTATLTDTTGTAITYTVLGAPVDIKQTKFAFQNIVGVSLVLYISGKDYNTRAYITPIIGDTTTINSITYKVQDVSPLRTQSNDVAYILFLEK